MSGMNIRNAPPDLVDGLAARVGGAHVITANAEMAPHLVEERGLYRGHALAVVRPRDTAEVAFVVAECARAGVAVVAQSGNTGGTGVLRYGNTRDLVLGLEVVLADWRVWNGLKGLRKDNAGYDLRNLFIGSGGTLGVITAAVLKLLPVP